MSNKKKKKNHGYERRREVLGILIMAFSLLIFIGLVSHDPSDYPNSGSVAGISNWLGLAGAWVSHYLFVYTIGYSSLVFPLLSFLLGWNIFLHKKFKIFIRISMYLLALGLFLSTVLALPHALSDEGSSLGYRLSGNFGGFFADQLSHFLGAAGSIVVLMTFLLLFLISATSWSMREFVLSFRGEVLSLLKKVSGIRIKWVKPLFNKKKKIVSVKEEKIKIENRDETSSGEQPFTKIEFETEKPLSKDRINAASLMTDKEQRSLSEKEERIKKAPKGPYILPSLDLLEIYHHPGQRFDRKELAERAHFLEDRLNEFGIEGKVTNVNPGPVITRFEVKPAPGVKINKFVSCQDDLALVMKATPVRVVAPIPGKAAVGIEIPNAEPEMVDIRSILDSKEVRKSSSFLTLALGKTITGKPYTTDLAQLPHLLVAGATGSGKSVCLNSIIMSILYRCRPEDVKLVLIDPKRLELSIYKRLKDHHLASCEGMNEKVITVAENAVVVLQSMTREMEKRYRLLAKVGVRDINDYNLHIKEKIEKKEETNLEKLPLIVLIVDELADLIMTGAGDIEEPITKLAQMARAVGIHLILATQRPSVDVITGLIKANFPARIAFQVASKTDSRTILDRNGAEKLLGRGDMLFMHPRKPDLIRIHGVFVSTKDIRNVVNHISQQPPAPDYMLKGLRTDRRDGIISPTDRMDELLRDAARLIIRHNQGSASLLQRRLRIGYARAGRIIDELEALGVVGPFDGSKARMVLVDETFLEKLNAPDFPDNILEENKNE